MALGFPLEVNTLLQLKASAKTVQQQVVAILNCAAVIAFHSAHWWLLATLLVGLPYGEEAASPLARHASPPAQPHICQPHWQICRPYAHCCCDSMWGRGHSIWLASASGAGEEPWEVPWLLVWINSAIPLWFSVPAHSKSRSLGHLSLFCFLCFWPTAHMFTSSHL